MNTLERSLELLKFIRTATPTQRDVQEELGISKSSAKTYLRQLESMGFVTTSIRLGNDAPGRAPRVFSIAPAWLGRPE